MLAHKKKLFTCAFLYAVFLFPTTALSNGNYLSKDNINVRHNFRVYYSLGYSNWPDLSQYGLAPLLIVGRSNLWRKDSPRSEPDFKKIDELLKYLTDKRIDLLCIDIEHWPTYKVEQFNLSKRLNNLSAIAKAFKKRLKGTAIGFYGILPARDYWSPVSGNEHSISSWKKFNSLVIPLSKSVDVVFPSLYTFYTDSKGWRKYAIANLKEARKYRKPVYAFVSPQYQTKDIQLSNKEIPGNFWRLQLETVYKYADGIVIWSPKLKKTEWDGNQSWWIETKEFLNSIR